MAVEIKYAGPIGFRANGLLAQQIMMLNDGSIHAVTYEFPDGPKGKPRTKAGCLIEDWDPETEVIWVYGRARYALQSAGTYGRLQGDIELVGPKGGMTDFGVQLGHVKKRSVAKWVALLTFPEFDANELLAKHIAFYAEVNAA